MIIEKSRFVELSTLRTEIGRLGLHQCFTSEELSRFHKPYADRSLCARYLAKQMIIEQLGEGLALKDINIINDFSGAPLMEFQHEEVRNHTNIKGLRNLLISFSHSRNWVGVYLIFDYF